MNMEKAGPIFVIINGIMTELSCESRIPSQCYQLFNRIENSITFAVAIVNHKSRNPIGTLGNLEFGP